jgi:hypothetical protein
MLFLNGNDRGDAEVSNRGTDREHKTTGHHRRGVGAGAAASRLDRTPVKRGTLATILDDVGMTADDLRALL